MLQCYQKSIQAVPQGVSAQHVNDRHSMHIAQVHGRYVAHNQVVKPAKPAQDDAVARRLWDVSCHLTRLKAACL